MLSPRENKIIHTKLPTVYQAGKVTQSRVVFVSVIGVNDSRRTFVAIMIMFSRSKQAPKSIIF